jgi:hypothetical protein
VRIDAQRDDVLVTQRLHLVADALVELGQALAVAQPALKLKPIAPASLGEWAGE